MVDDASRIKKSPTNTDCTFMLGEGGMNVWFVRSRWGVRRGEEGRWRWRRGGGLTGLYQSSPAQLRSIQWSSAHLSQPISAQPCSVGRQNAGGWLQTFKSSAPSIPIHLHLHLQPPHTSHPFPSIHPSIHPSLSPVQSSPVPCTHHHSFTTHVPSLLNPHSLSTIPNPAQPQLAALPLACLLACLLAFPLLHQSSSQSAKSAIDRCHEGAWFQWRQWVGWAGRGEERRGEERRGEERRGEERRGVHVRMHVCIGEAR